MAVEVIMPKVDMDQDSGTVLEWLKQEGDPVSEGEPLLIIETDKVSIEVEAPGAGVLQGVRALVGDVIPVGEVIAYLLAPGEDPPPLAEKKPATLPPESGTAANSKEARQIPHATPLAQRMADEQGINLAEITGSGKGGRVTRTDLPGGPGAVRATPAARRLARKAGVRLGELAGSGPSGRIQQDDVERAIQIEGQSPSEGPEDEPIRISLNGMRRRIASRLTESYQQIPHITFTSKVDMGAFVEARTHLNSYAERHDKARVTATALFVKIASVVLRDHPWVNASFKDDEVWLHKHVNMGVAVALDDGLIVPVIREADRKKIDRIARELEDLVGRARQGRLELDEVHAGTFTISNLGPFGIEQFTAIINPPQAGILAIGATQDEVVPDASGQVVVRPTLRMTLSVDHRIVDGATAAHFMRDLKTVLEAPVLLLNSD